MSPMPGRNPYRPGVGVAPLHLAGRDGEVRRLQAALREAPSSPANVRVTGLRGVGKSVLLGEFERVAADEGWAVGRVDLEHRYDTPDGIVSVISIACQRVGDRMSRPERTGSAAAALGAPMAKVEADFEDVKADLEPGGSDHDVELARVLYDATVGVTEHGRAGLAILMDEAHVLERPAALSVLMSAVLTLQRQMVPIALVVSGLPHLLAQLRQARGYDENMFRGEVLGPLDGSASREALERPLDGTGIMMDADLVDKVVAQTEGYPNFIQVWGAEPLRGHPTDEDRAVREGGAQSPGTPRCRVLRAESAHPHFGRAWRAHCLGRMPLPSSACGGSGGAFTTLGWEHRHAVPPYGGGRCLVPAPTGRVLLHRSPVPRVPRAPGVLSARVA